MGIEKNVKAVIKNQNVFLDIINDYEFTEQSFFVENKRQGKVEVKYSDVYKAIESNGFLYLYVDKRIAYIIRKKDITEGTEEELRQILTAALKEKYKGKR